ncbi:MAG: type II toxin-antitoxin system RelE/ParE family toxin [Nocardiopsaceae bacterium]|jgi:plasmid stabilization system protein ParE|nr:type II toxin-antitoxin system RelE/ParE family toxin [Nocardiopsaceae bacterium]
MTLAFDLHPEAQAEFAADVDWYDEREVGVGGRFAESVRAAVDAAVDDPDAWAKWPGWHGHPVVRSKGVAGFPYHVVYYVEDDLLTVIAVAHAKRRPGYWRDRVTV